VADSIFRAVEYVRNLHDIANVTDDVDGEASILDDQEIQFVKQRTDAAFVSDVLVATFVVIRDFTNAAALSDVITTAFTKNTLDTSLAFDAAQLLTGKHAYDILVTADSASQAFAKHTLDTPLAFDAVNMLTGKQVYDIPVTTESASKAFMRGRADTTLVGDANFVRPGKGLLETASTTDAGSLRSQGYADFTYFAEDYVGASRTF